MQCIAILLMGIIGAAVSLPADFKLPNVNISTVAEINALHYPNDRISTDAISPGPVGVEDTVKEVENLLKKNLNLPRLTRGEILDILDNITKTDKQKLEKIRTRNEDSRAIMVVMPYSGENGNVQELYTKPPITHIIEEGKDSTKKPYTRRRTSTKKPEIVKDSTTQKPYTRKRYHKTTSTTPLTPSLSESTTVTTSTSSTTTSSTTTEKQFFTDTKSVSTAKPFTYMKPTNFRRRQTTTTPSFRPITTKIAPSVIKYTNHKYPDEIADAQTFSNEGIRIISPPSAAIYVTTRKPSMRPIVVADKPVKLKPSAALKPQNTGVNLPLSEDFQLPENLKDVVKDLDFLIRNNPNQFNDDFIPLPDSPNKQINKENVKELLETLATYQNQQQKIRATTTTTTEAPDMTQVADNLTPDMKELLMSFGLIPDPNPKPIPAEIIETPLEPNSEIKPESFLSFKPLPQHDEGGNDDMNTFLASFGLGRNAARSQKAIAFQKTANSITGNKDEEVNFDAVPEKFKSILGDIGLTKDTFKGQSFKPKEPENTHVFSPSDTQYASKEEIEKLNQLLGVIKQLEKINGTATEADLKGIDLDNLKHLVGSLNGEPFVPLNEQTGPNPESDNFDYIRNEVKRQTSTVASVVVSASTDGIANGAIADLEASFGGSSSVATEEPAPEPTEPPKRTGFYYLVDWNSFFDIDNQKGKRVNLRFQPKIGDPRRFLSVTVP